MKVTKSKEVEIQFFEELVEDLNKDGLECITGLLKDSIEGLTKYMCKEQKSAAKYLNLWTDNLYNENKIRIANFEAFVNENVFSIDDNIPLPQYALQAIYNNEMKRELDEQFFILCNSLKGVNFVEAALNQELEECKNLEHKTLPTITKYETAKMERTALLFLQALFESANLLKLEMDEVIPEEPEQ